MLKTSKMTDAVKLTDKNDSIDDPEDDLKMVISWLESHVNYKCWESMKNEKKPKYDGRKGTEHYLQRN